MIPIRPWLATLLLAATFAANARAAEPEFRIQAARPGPVRVACVGDSITYGAGVAEREKNCYPASLQRMLGAKYETQNFGRSGATLLRKGDLPYWRTKEFTNATAFGPDIVIIKLGTNDTKPQNWTHREEFAADARALVEHFRALPGKPMIYLCLPVPVYQDRWGINEATVKGGVIPALKQVAKEMGVSVIDLHGAMSNRVEMFPDGVHPNQIGAMFLAQAVRYEIAPH